MNTQLVDALVQVILSEGGQCPPYRYSTVLVR